MDKRLTYQDYASFARLSLAELARQCEAEAFRATGPEDRVLTPPTLPCACVTCLLELLL